MSNSVIWKRGQIWHWEDPIFKEKSEGKIVNLGEATMRFSRYVLVVQDLSKVLNPQMVVVVPLSHSRTCSSNVAISCNNDYFNSVSFVRVERLFPAHVKSLMKYICTLSDEDMNKIDAELIKLLLPKISTVNHETTSMVYDIDMKYDDTVPTESESEFVNQIRKFAVEKVTITNKDSDKVSVWELKAAFDSYSIDNDLPIVDDIVSFLNVFCHITRSGKYENIINMDLNFIEFTGIKLNMSATVQIPVKNEKARTKWDDETKELFITLYRSLGIDSVIKEFNITEKTAISYYYKWRNNYGIPGNDDVKMVSLTNAMEAISYVSNLIKKKMERNKVMSTVAYKGLPFTTINNVYNKLGNCIYNSLLSFLCIYKDENNKPIISDINDKSEGTWKFIIDTYDNQKLLKINSTNFITIYRNINNGGGISKDWIPIFARKLTNAFDEKIYNINRICRIAEKEFCE